LAEQQAPIAAVPASTTGPGSVESTRAASPAVTQQRIVGITTVPASTASHRRSARAARPASPAITQQPRSPTITASLTGTGRTRAAGPAVAEQPPAGSAVCPTTWGPVCAVADQRAPRQVLHR
jgi:hypothetical protein